MNRTSLFVLLLVVSSVSMFSAGFTVPADAQTSQNVVINELDVNPPGSDARSAIEWVELYNPADSDVDLSGWQIASTTALKKTLTIPSGTVIGPQDYMVFLHQTLWLSDTVESVELLDQNDMVIDKTPILADTDNDFNTWQRVYDGVDSDSITDWKFVPTTAGGSNGVIVSLPEIVALSMTVSTTESSYTLGQTATIQGTVSELAYTDRNLLTPASVTVLISGPDFESTATVYPDSDLNYSTTLSLHQTLGVDYGLYSVTATYGDASATVQFTVNPVDSGPVVDTSMIAVTTDKPQYFPGETISITGVVDDIVQQRPMTFTVVDPNGDLVADGTSFATDGEFLTDVFLSNVNPAYGVYTVTAMYFHMSASATFSVLEETPNTDVIILSTQEPAFGLGDQIQINGKLNHVWTPTLDLEITQTTLSGAATDFEIADELSVSDDGLFDYNFTVSDDSGGVGLYTATVSQNDGTISSSIIIYVVANPDGFVVSDDLFTVSADNDIYTLGEEVTISGLIADSRLDSVYTVVGSGLQIFVSSAEDDTSLAMRASQSSFNADIRGERFVEYDFAAVPDSSGRYSVDFVLTPGTFSAGDYTVTAKYFDRSVTTTFTVIESLSFIGGPIITLDRQIYGLGDTIILSGVAPATAASWVDISITKPDGSVISSQTPIEDQRFLWSWTTPERELRQDLPSSTSDRVAPKSNFGIYKLQASVDRLSSELFFKVSQDPQNDFISTEPLSVSTDKSLYLPGDVLRVTGSVLVEPSANESFLLPKRVTIQVIDGNSALSKIIYESNVYPQQGGLFSSSFDLPLTVFTEETYLVKATFEKLSETITFGVVNDYGREDVDDTEASLLISTDKEQYSPGDVVTITGLSSKLTYVESFDVSISKQTVFDDGDDDATQCETLFCGVQLGPTTSVRPTSSASFTHHFAIDDTDSALGSYQVTVDAGFDTQSILFDVVAVESSSPTVSPPLPPPSTLIVKENRIPDDNITVSTPITHANDTVYAPRVLSGSLVTPSFEDQSIVNIKVSTQNGLCIIGPGADCLVSESTQVPGSIYDTVEIDGASYNVRYTGPDVRLEKFSILPESSDELLPEADWDIQIIKDDQVSRFYYKVTYKLSLE